MITGRLTRPIPAHGERSLDGALGVLLVAAIALGLRWAATRVDGLWVDELYGATYANLSLWEVVVAVLRFDIHPPFYYLQLWFWALWSKSDAWLMFNSVACSTLTAVLVASGVARMGSRWVGLLAGLSLALLGSEVFFASELRMYALISLLTVCGWLTVDRWVDHRARSSFWLLLLVLFVLAGTHSAAFVSVGSILLYLGLRELSLERHLRRWKEGIWIALGALAFLAPWLINASFRSVSHTGRPDLALVTNTFRGWLLGYFPQTGPLPGALALAVVALLVGFSLVYGNASARRVVLSFVVFPVLCVGSISWGLRPIWLDRTLAFVAPFLVIGGAYSIVERSRAIRLAVPLALLLAQSVLLLMPGGIWDGMQQSRKMQFREAADHIKAINVEALDVYVPMNNRFWGIARYLVGEGWGSPLAVQDPERVDRSEVWTGIYKKLGPQLLGRLHLVPVTRHVKANGYRVWIGLSDLPRDVYRRGYFFVGDMNDASRQTACPVGVEQSRKVFRGVLVVQCRDLNAG